MKKASTKDTKKAATTRGGSGGAGGGNNNTSATGGAATITTTNNPNVNVSGGPGAGGLLYELPEQNIVIWPEWSDAEVMAEKWTTKHIFEDGEGAILLPRSLRPMFEGYKRPVELSTDIPVGLTSPANLESLFSTQQTVGGGGGGGLSLTGSTLQGAVNGNLNCQIYPSTPNTHAHPIPYSPLI